MRSAATVSIAFAAWMPSGAVAGLVPGTAVRAVPASGTSSAISRTDAALGPGTYASDLAGTDFAGRAFAQLAWGASAVTFAGLAHGGSDAMVRTQGIAMLEFTETMQFAISWAMAAAVGPGIETSWGLVDAAGDGTPTVGVSASEGTLVSFGGASPTAGGSFSGAIGPGTYLLIMLSEATSAAGQIGLSASFTAVPGPSAAALLPVAAWALRQRRRRNG